jgi:tetratricopeptide (TPR) repeat protein
VSVWVEIGAHRHWGSWVCFRSRGWKLLLTRDLSKSQIAIEFTYRVRKTAPETWVFWVDAKDVASVKSSYRKIAKAVQVPGHDEQDADIFTLVRDWLLIEGNGPWVVVIDSADDTSVLTEPICSVTQSASNTDVSSLPQLREFMPISQNGSVLITSTNTEAAQMLTGNCAHHIEVEEMNEAEALALLKSKLHSKVVYTEDEAKELVKAAEYMPLAISQTAARISMDYPRINLTQATEKLNFPDQDATRLLEGSVHETNRDTRRTNSVVKSWHSNFQYVREKNPSAARLLSLMCLFDRQGIPEALLTGQYGEEATAALAPAPPHFTWWKRIRRRRGRKHKRSEKRAATKDTKKSFDEDWRVLNNLMLIKTNLDGHHFNMHRLIQHTTARWLELNGELKAWMKKYIDIMQDYFPKPEHDNWKVCNYLFPHAQRTAKFRPSDQAVIRPWVLLIQNIAQFAYIMRNLSAAEALSRTALETFLTLHGERNGETLYSLHQLGRILHSAHKLPEAESLLYRAWEGRLILLGPDHLATLESARTLGMVLNAQNKYLEGEAMQTRVLEGYERVFGPTHTETQSLMSGLALTYLTNGRVEQAEKLHRRVYGIRKDAFGEESNDTYQNMRALAVLLTMQGKAAEAESIHRQVVQAREAKLGLHDVETIRSVNFLCEALVKQGKLEDATMQYRRVLDVLSDLDDTAREEALGSLDHLAQVLLQQGLTGEAESVARTMVGERERLLGLSHCDTFVGYHTLAEILTQQEQFAAALDMYEKAYTCTLSLLDAAHPDTIEFLNDFNAARNRLLVWDGDQRRSSGESAKVVEYVGVPNVALAFQSPALVPVLV